MYTLENLLTGLTNTLVKTHALETKIPYQAKTSDELLLDAFDYSGYLDKLMTEISAEKVKPPKFLPFLKAIYQQALTLKEWMKNPQTDFREDEFIDFLIPLPQLTVVHNPLMSLAPASQEDLELETNVALQFEIIELPSNHFDKAIQEELIEPLQFEGSNKALRKAYLESLFISFKLQRSCSEHVSQLTAAKALIKELNEEIYNLNNPFQALMAGIHNTFFSNQQPYTSSRAPSRSSSESEKESKQNEERGNTFDMPFSWLDSI